MVIFGAYLLTYGRTCERVSPFLVFREWMIHHTAVHSSGSTTALKWSVVPMWFLRGGENGDGWQIRLPFGSSSPSPARRRFYGVACCPPLNLNRFDGVNKRWTVHRSWQFPALRLWATSCPLGGEIIGVSEKVLGVLVGIFGCAYSKTSAC